MTADVPGWERRLIQWLFKTKPLETTFGSEWELTSSLSVPEHLPSGQFVSPYPQIQDGG